MRRVFVAPDLSLVLALPRLRALLGQLGWPKGVAKSASHRALARFLFGGVVSDGLADALEEIARLAPDDGRRALFEGARATKTDTTKWPVGEGGAGIAAHVVRAGAKNDPGAARVLRRAHIRLNRLYPPRMAYDLAASAAARDTACDAAIAKGVGAVAGRDLDDVWHVRGDDGHLHVAVLYYAPAVVEVVGGALTSFRALRSDVLCIDFEMPRVSITTATPEWLSAYGGAIGRIAWGDPRALLSRPSITFKPPQERGVQAVKEATLPSGVRSIAVTAWLLDTGDGTRTEVRGDDDALAAAGELVAGSGGYFRRLNVRVGIDGAPYPVDVVMQLPNIVRFSDARWERQARAAVAAVGLFAPGTMPDDAWTLAPFVHPEWRWRMVLGDAAVDLLSKKKMLVRVSTKKVASAEYRALAWSVTTHDVPGEPAVKYAVTDDRSADARDVADEARVMLRLDVGAVVTAMRGALGAVAATRGKEVAGGVDLGEIATKDGVARIVYAMTRPTKGFLEGVRRACGVKATPVVLVPEGRAFATPGVAQIEVSVAEQMGIVDGRELRGRLGDLLDVDELRDGGERAIANAASLVVEEISGRVWLYGVPMTEMATSGEKFIACLVAADGRAVAAKEVGSFISPSADYPDVIGRNVRKQIDRWVAASFARAGRPVPAEIAGGLIVREAKGGYRLVIRGVVR
jgi:hypothetical protein